MTTTLPLFWKLSSNSKKDRVDASVQLISALEQFQSKFIPKSHFTEAVGLDLEDGEKVTDGLDGLNAQDVAYSIRRLIRGLASPRESSRLGFAVALTELVSRLNSVACSQIVTLIINSTGTSGSMTGQEDRDMLFARLFGLTAVIQSGLLVKEIPLVKLGSSSTSPSSLQSYNEVISHLLGLGEEKSWLRESVWWSLMQGIESLRSAEVSWKDDAVSSILQSVFITNTGWSPEKLAIAIRMQCLYPSLQWHDFLIPPFKSADLLKGSNLVVIAKILKESSIEDEDGQNVSSAARSWRMRIHFVWDIILDQLLPSPESSLTTRGSIAEFFRVVVDESLFSASSSPQRKHWGFQVFRKALNRIAKDDLPMLFTKNFMRTWINHLSKNDRNLHKMAQQVAADICALVQRHPTIGLSVILQLTGTHGSKQFDKITKTKTVESILGSMSSGGIKDYIDFLFRQAHGVETDGSAEDPKSIHSRREWVHGQLRMLIRNNSIPKSDEWIQSILDWLTVNGLFVVRKPSSKSPYFALRSPCLPPFSEDLRRICRMCLLACLGDLTVQAVAVKKGERTSKVFGVAGDGESWISKVLGTVELLQHDTKHVKPCWDVTQEGQSMLTKVYGVLERLQKSPYAETGPTQGAQFLLQSILLHRCCVNQSSKAEDESALEVDSIHECANAVERMCLNKPGAHDQATNHASLEGTEPDPIDILVDTIIGCLEKPTAYLRVTANRAFSLLSQSTTKTAVDLITTQFERRDPTISEHIEDDLLEDDSEEENDDSSHSHNDQNDEEQPIHQELDDVAEESDGIDSGDESLDVEIREQVKDAFRSIGVETRSDSDDSEELLDDEQMMAIDEQLAQVFQSRVKGKTSKDKNAQREATHFKNRVLDLVDIFVKEQPKSAHVMRFINPLLALVDGSGLDERQLTDKATGILRNRIGRLKDSPSENELDRDYAVSVLRSLHDMARRIHSADLLVTVSQCSFYVSKILLHIGAEEEVSRIYRSSLEDFLTRKASSFNNKFFEDFFRRFPLAAWDLRNDLIELSQKSANTYRRCQAFQFIQTLISQSSCVDEHQEEFLMFIPVLRQALYEFLLSARNDSSKVTAAQIKDLLKLGLVSVKQTKRVHPDFGQLADLWRPDDWDSLCNKLLLDSRFSKSPGLQKMCQQMVQLSSKPNISNETSNNQKGNLLNNVKRKAGLSADTIPSSPGKNKRLRTQS